MFVCLTKLLCCLESHLIPDVASPSTCLIDIYLQFQQYLFIITGLSLSLKQQPIVVNLLATD